MPDSNSKLSQPPLLPEEQDSSKRDLDQLDYVISDAYDGVPRKMYPKICTCGKTFYVPKHRYAESRFCSKECSSIGHQQQIEYLCAGCGKTFYRAKGRLKKSKHGIYFCSRDCKDNSQANDGLKAIQPPHYGTGEKNYRARAFRRLGKRCSQCGYDEYEQMLDVDHIDSNRSNNRLENLQVLCLWCHGLKTRGIPFHHWAPKSPDKL